MSRTRITIRQEFESQREFLCKLPGKFESDDGTTLYEGRNTVRLFVSGGRRYVVKRFHRLNLLKAVIYTFFRHDKARHAYWNSIRLIEKGVLTPEPVAVIGEYSHGLLRDAYYVSGYTDWNAIRKPLTEDVPFDRLMTADYARFVATLHQKGIIHKDLNNTNVLYHNGESHYEFMLIDVNRMAFTKDGEPPADKACLENLTLFADRGEMFDFFAAEYIKARGWSESRITDVFEAKARHDHHWHRKQAFKKFIKSTSFKF